MRLVTTVLAMSALIGTLGMFGSGCSSDEPSGSGGKGGAGGAGGAAAIDCTTQAGKDECIRRALLQSCDAVGGCTCRSCCQELQDCEADPGCVAIRTCATEKNCRGLACYAAATCMQVVDDNGGPGGISGSLGLVLSDCTTAPAVACPDRCP